MRIVGNPRLKDFLEKDFKSCDGSETVIVRNGRLIVLTKARTVIEDVYYKG